jgi:hypothetical protein
MRMGGFRDPTVSNTKEEDLFPSEDTVVLFPVSDRKQPSAVRRSNEGPMRIKLKEVSSQG